MGSNNLKVPMWLYFLPIILALTSLGCSLANLVSRAGADAGATPTRTPMPTFTATPAGAAFVQIPPTAPPPTNTPAPSPTQGVAPAEPESPLPTPEPTEPPSANQPVTITVLQNMNVRTGPGTNYPIAGPGPAGETTRVVGRNPDSSWLQVEYPLTADGTGWVYASLVQINGDPATVEVVQAAPPPVAAAPPPQPEAQEAPPPAPEAPKYQFTPTGWHASENAAICHFKGRIKDEGGNLVNGYSVYVTNDGWGVISHPTGASNHYPDKGDGEWDVAGIELHNCPGWWKLAVVKYECPDFFASFDAQCKQYSILSEQIPIQIVYPDEMVINADWVCHWDCDKGVYSQAFRR